ARPTSWRLYLTDLRWFSQSAWRSSRTAAGPLWATGLKEARRRRRPRGFLRRLDLQGVTGRGTAIRRLARSGELPYRPPSARRLRLRDVNAGFPPSLPVANLPLEPQPGGSG